MREVYLLFAAVIIIGGCRTPATERGRPSPPLVASAATQASASGLQPNPDDGPPPTLTAVETIERQAKDIEAAPCDAVRAAFDKAKAKPAINTASLSAAVDADDELAPRRQKALQAIIARVETCTRSKTAK